ncbi:MAG: hypothetical protein FWF15_05560 [Oscillospiraceae bacterium]|nr:hypothetical protein [Oscillospiraceae bacterium]
MLKVKIIPVLAGIVSKIEIQPIIERMKTIDISENQTTEQQAIIVFELIAAITPQLGAIAEDIPQLIALYKEISVEEAGELDFIEIIKELLGDKGIINFFSTALRGKAAREI